MRRREFITLVAGAVGWPLASSAQQPQRVRRIGVLTNFAEDDRDAQSWINAFQQRLKDLGWNGSGKSKIDVRWAAGSPDRLRSYAEELVGLQPDVIFGNSTPPVAALQRLTRTIPIVFVGANNPVGSGFVASVARPGGNITGFVNVEPIMGGKWLEILKEIAADIGRVALVFNPRTHTGQYFQSLETASAVLAIKLVRMQYEDAAELESRINEFAREPKGGLLALPDSSNAVHRRLIIQLAARHRLPAVYANRQFVTSDGLAYYGAQGVDQYNKAAEYVDRILRGEKPADLPVQGPTKFELVINLKTAKALGLTIPPLLLARADALIE